jgi:hypothetical protein
MKADPLLPLTDAQLERLLALRRARLHNEQRRQYHYLKHRPVPESAATRVRARLAQETNQPFERA